VAEGETALASDQAAMPAPINGELAGAAAATALEQPVPGESQSAEPARPTAPAAPAPGTTDANNGLFSGGKNHYLQSMKKNKTHRHHKRRNRHQTLRK